MTRAIFFAALLTVGGGRNCNGEPVVISPQGQWAAAQPDIRVLNALAWATLYAPDPVDRAVCEADGACYAFTRGSAGARATIHLYCDETTCRVPPTLRASPEKP